MEPEEERIIYVTAPRHRQGMVNIDGTLITFEFLKLTTNKVDIEIFGHEIGRQYELKIPRAGDEEIAIKSEEPSTTESRDW